MAELPVWGAAVSAVTLLAEFLLGGQGAGAGDKASGRNREAWRSPDIT